MFKLTSLATEILQINLERLKVSHDDGAERLFNCLKSIEAGSNKISTWSLSTLGGSILAILSTDYNAPRESLFRLIYLLFVLGWIFLGIAFFEGKRISAKTIAAELHKGNKDQLSKMFKSCNGYYARQLKFFNYALLIFGIWLLLYVTWWIFGDSILHCLNLSNP